MNLEDISFLHPKLEDRELIEGYLSLINRQICDLTFTNIYLWSRFFKTEFAIYKDTLLFKSKNEQGDTSFVFPVGELESVKIVLKDIREYFHSRRAPFNLHLVMPWQFEILEELYPEEYSIEYQRDLADYVYSREKLATLTGKKYHGKRNHINKFLEEHSDWSFEPMSVHNIEDCFQMSLAWRRKNDVGKEEEKGYEIAMTQNALRLFEELKLQGGVLRISGEVVAFTIGERLNQDTFVVHIEKAFSEIQGAYPMINREFVRYATEGFTYINREEDTGSEGLRKAKLSYRPEFLSEKGVVKEKEK